MNTTVTNPGAERGTVVMDSGGRIRIPRGGAMTVAVMRIALGLVYLWAFIAQGFGIGYTNKATPPPDAPANAPTVYEWTFDVDTSNGSISSCRSVRAR